MDYKSSGLGLQGVKLVNILFPGYNEVKVDSSSGGSGTFGASGRDGEFLPEIKTGDLDRQFFVGIL